MSVTRRGVRMPAFAKSLFKTGAVKAGVLAGATYPDDMLTDARTGKQAPDRRAGMPVAAIAMALEYGHGQNHPRPFMQNSVANHGSQWAESLRALLKDGKSSAEALLIMGQIMKEDIQETIRSWPEDNAPSWAEFKGFNKGLKLTGHLESSIESEVEGGE
jgi:hypothetical protein